MTNGKIHAAPKLSTRKKAAKTTKEQAKKKNGQGKKPHGVWDDGLRQIDGWTAVTSRVVAAARRTRYG